MLLLLCACFVSLGVWLAFKPATAAAAKEQNRNGYKQKFLHMIGKVSWFGGPNDSMDSGHTASGGTTKEPGIAVYNHSTLGGYWRVTTPNGKTAILKQTDIGPAPWTGRKVDITYSALGHFGYNEGNFPTDQNVHAEYLGKNKPQQATTASQSPSKPIQGTKTIPGTPGTPATLDKAAFAQATQKQEGLALLGKVFRESGGGKFPYSMPKPNPAEFTTPGTPGTPSRVEQQPSISGGGSKGYVNPHRGETPTSEDMGLDYSAKPGKTIPAVGDAKILGVSPNWYKGQPYLFYELTSGPRKGQVIYVSEQITPLVHAGQTVPAGHPIARYAGSGTGIEEGFGTRTGGQTQSQARGERKGELGGRNTRSGAEYKRFLQRETK